MITLHGQSFSDRQKMRRKLMELPLADRQFILKLCRAFPGTTVTRVTQKERLWSEMQLSPHFTLEEATATSVDHPNIPPASILEEMVTTAWRMEGIRALLGEPIHVRSWFRSPTVNAAVGGSASSDHQFGCAVEFTISHATAQEIAQVIQESGFPFDQLITYAERPHVYIGFGSRMRGQRLHL